MRRYLLAFVPAPALAVAAVMAVPSAVGPALAQDAAGEATGFGALQVDPETATQLVTLGGALRDSCTRGRRDACELNEQLTELSDLIVAGRSACLAGNQRGCALAERASEQVGELYGRLSR